MTEGFSQRLRRGPILCDGAMGTQLVQRTHLTPDQCLEELSLTQPDVVKAVHLDYIQAGAEIIETNTFGANRFRLAAHGLEDRREEINRAGVELAKDARRLTGQHVWIAGSMGPLGGPVARPGGVTKAQAHEAFREQAGTLAAAGADLLILETFTDLREAQVAIKAAREVTDLPIVAQMSFNQDGATAAGDTPRRVVRAFERLGVAACGANCSVGSEHMLRVAREMSEAAHVPVSAQPNAGFPSYEGGRLIYQSSPDYVGQRARAMAEAGVTLLGGGCGTSPEHIAAIRDALRNVRAPRAEAGPVTTRERQGVRPVPMEPTGLAKKLGRRFVVTAEVAPPKGFDASEVLASLAELKTSGAVDALHAADSPRAQGRMSALALSSLIQGRLGVEAVLHLALRHRNLLALHSELMGAHALGVRNVFVVMGDPPSIGDYPAATAVADSTPSRLIRLIKSFNKGLDANGEAMAQATSFLVGCALNLNAPDLDRELRGLRRKVEAGADFVLTQPVYGPRPVEEAESRLGGFPVPVLLGVLPLRSSRHAEFLHNEVPGISIPEATREHLRRAGKQASEVGASLSREVIESVRDKVAGVYVIPPFGRYRTVLDVTGGMPGDGRAAATG